MSEQPTQSLVDVGAAADIAPGKFVTATVDGRGFIIARVDDRYYAVEDNCSHEDYPLSYLSLIHISEPTRLLRRSRMPSSA